MSDTTKRYLTAVRDDKLAQAKLFRAVAATIKTEHKKFTKRTFEHDEAYIGTAYRRSFNIRYQQTRPDFYRGNESMSFYLTTGIYDDDVSPMQVHDDIIFAAQHAEQAAAKLTVEIETITDVAEALKLTIEGYNIVVDGLTSYGREALGVQHIYNHKLGA